MIVDPLLASFPHQLKKLLLTPPNVPAGIDANKEGSRNRNNNRSLYLKPIRPLVKVSAIRHRDHTVQLQSWQLGLTNG